MALLSLLFSDPQIKTIVGSITLDASIREFHELSSDATDNPVESGSYVSDHIFNRPPSLTIEGIISDSPIGGVSPVSLFGVDAVIEGSALKSLGAWLALRKLWEDRQLFSVVTGLQNYQNMRISRLSVPRNTGTVNALRFTIDLMYIEIVKSQVVLIPKDDMAEDENHHASSQDVGNQPTSGPDADQTEAASVAYRAIYGN